MAITLAAFACGSVALRLISPGVLAPAERSLYAVAIGFGVMSYATLALGLAGLLVAWAAVALILVPLAITSRQLRDDFTALRPRLSPPARGPAGPLLAAGCVWAIVILVVAVSPEVAYDSLSYHLGLPRVWIDAGRMVDVPEQLQSYYYLAAEMTFTLAMLLGGTAAAKLVSLTVFVLAVAAVYVVARSMFSARAAAIGTALFATTPAIAWQGTTTYVDVVVTLYVFLGAFTALRAHRSVSPRLAVIAGLLLGLAVATKLTAALTVAPVLLFLGLTAVRPALDRRRMAVFAVSAAALAGVLAPWPTLRFLQTGNPVFPLFNGIFQSPLWPPVDVVSNPAYSLERFGLGKDLAGLMGTPFAFSYAAERFDDAALGAGFGIALLLLPLALVRRWQSRDVRYLAAISVVSLVLWALAVPYARYVMPAFAALSVLAGVGLDDLAGSADRLTARVAGAVAPLLMIVAFPLLVLQYQIGSGRIPYAVALGLETRETYLSRALPSYVPLQRVAESAGRESHVLLLSFHAGGADDEDRLYAPGRVETISSLWTQALVRIPDRDTALSTIRDRGFTHVYVNRRFVSPLARGSAVMDPAFFEGAAVLEYQDDGVELYRLR